MKMALTILMTLAVGACASTMPTGGYASYDALKRAQADCAAKGGTLRLAHNGDAQYLGDYACERK